MQILHFSRRASAGINRRFRGFTAIELMVTVAIAAILAALAAPSFSSLTERWQVRQAADDLRSNMVRGGQAAATELTAREREICERIGPDLKRLGLMFVGIDVIAGRLTEINVTSPTGIVAIDRFNGTNIPAIFWSKVEALRATA